MTAELSAFQTFNMVQMARSTIVEHPDNPRRISDSAKKKIRDTFKTVGMLQPPIVNSMSGYLISGHQRIAVLDSLEHYKPGGAKDYLLDVAVVELDQDAEAKMLVFLNNQDAQGDWNLDKLAELAIGSGVDISEMGFDKASLEVLFDGDSRFEELFQDDEETQQTKAALNDMKTMSDSSKREDGPSLKAVKAEREGFNKRRDEKSNSDYYVVVVCDTAEQKTLLMKHLGLPAGEQYIAPHEIMSMMRP